MSDLSAGALPGSNIADSINAAVKSAPELGQSPGLAIGVATSGGDTPGRAQAVARGVNAITDATAKQNTQSSVGGDISGALNWFGNSVAHVASDVVTPIEHGLSDVAGAVGKTLNGPMQFVQHEYRYLHDVEARHGMQAALLEGIGIAAGAAGGFALTGNVFGAELGAEGATALEGQLFYKDSWARTTNGATYTDPHTHQLVSFGRDLASWFGEKPHSLQFNITSGLIDGIADLQVGGSEVAGVVGEARSVEGLGGALHNYFPGISAATAEDFEQSYLRYGAVQQTMRDIAGKNAGEIVATPAYQSLMIAARKSTAAGDALTTNDFIKALGEASTQDEVAEVFRDALRTHELVGMDTVPTLSFTRVPFQALREAAEDNSAGLSIARKFIRLPSAVVDGAVSMKEFDPTDPLDNGAVGLYRTLMYTENRRTASSVVQTYIDGNLSDKYRIYRQAVMDTLVSMSREFGGNARDMDANDMHAIKEAIDHFTGGAEPGAEGWYGLNDEGRNLSYVKDTGDGDRQFAAAITDNQTGKLRFISLSEMRSAAHSIAGYRGIFGNVAKADDFLYDHVTQALFKPLVLLTPSYALHIALAEVIPNALRLGVVNFVRSAIAFNAAKLGTAAASEEEVSAIAGLTWRLLGLHSARRAAELVAADPEELSKMGRRIQLAARYIEFNGGDRLAPGLSAGHNLSNEVNREFRNTNILRTSVANTPMMRGNTFAKFGQGDKGYLESWASWINADLVKDEKTRIAAATLRARLVAGASLDDATRDAVASVSTWLHDQPQSYLNRYMRGLSTSRSVAGDLPLGTDQLDDWAQNVVANLRGATRGANHGPVNMGLLQHIADGDRVNIDTLEAIPEHERPINVKGRELVPDPGQENVIRRIANNGFQHVLNPMVNFISRQPIAFTEFERQYNRLLPQIRGGIMDEDEAMTVAMAKTSNIVIRNVHNLTDRTQWSTTLRNWAPFYFAQEQAYRRMGRLLAENPRAFRQYQLMISNVHDIGQVLNGPNGQGYFVVPGTGYLTDGVVGGMSKLGLPVFGSSPVGMGWNLNSMSVIFPTSNGIRPDLGPVVAVPIQAIANFFPEMGAPALKADVSAAEQAVIGPQAASSPIWEQILPNTILDRLMEAANGGMFVTDRSFDSTVMQVMQALDYEGKLPTGPGVSAAELQQTADRIRNQVRIWYVMKALLGAITPVSPEIQVQGEGLRNTYDADLAAWDIATTPGSASLAAQGYSMNDLGFPPELNADIKAEGSLAKGIRAYLVKHPDATPASVFEQTHPGATAYTVPQSGSPSGAYITASAQAEQWINDHGPLLAKYPMAGIYLMPQLTDTKYNPTIYNEQIAQGLRVKLNPDTGSGPLGSLPSYIQQLYIAAGNARFFSTIYPKYLQSVNGLTPSQKYGLEQTFYDVTLPQFEQQNPIWGEWWTSDTKQQDRNQAVTELQAMFRAGDAPPGKLTDEIKVILDGYENYKQQYYELVTNNQSTSSWDAAWQGYLTATAIAHPELRAFINAVFTDIPTSTLIAGGQ